MLRPVNGGREASGRALPCPLARAPGGAPTGARCCHRHGLLGLGPCGRGIAGLGRRRPTLDRGGGCRRGDLARGFPFA